MNDPLATRFEALLEPGTPDWLDVHRRARRRSRRIWVIAAVAAVFLAIPTIAIALDPRILPWASAKPAPAPVVHDFAKLSVGLARFHIYDPHIRPGEARTVPLPDGGTVWIAPGAKHSLCALFKNTQGGTCEKDEQTPAIDATLTSDRSFPCPDRFPATIFYGHVKAKPGSTLQLRFSDGAVSSLPIVWIGPPINAGFFEHRVPRGSHTSALVLRNPSGSILSNVTHMRLPNLCKDEHAHRRGVRPSSGWGIQAPIQSSR